ncbi:MAG: prolipoprotein diacylglyceryl transferase [Clostridium sp.]|nr:prolipoprotein diacylglyceryl transferase [Clostridium sp.]MCM1398252.1 prolipoprotein diacylglyceryl transferase [Clostridium sp.]MCM1460334.1 prolipoprotein diacylglyceryl transferase [Bacteroides sp.]
MYDIRFPNLGIILKNVKDGFSIFGFEIKFYGIIIALGFLFAYILVSGEAKRTGQNDELYLDYILWLIIPSIIGARIYYIIFSWNDYFQAGKGFKQTFIDVINIRQGGLAIYGGIIAGVIVTVLFAKKKKVKFSLMADTICIGLLVGQIMGRWGNFFNREAFGEYTDSLFAMQIPVNYFSAGSSLNGLVNAGVITQKMAENVVSIDGMSWISVHPTFLYESLWNLVLLIFIMVYRRHKKFDGELFLLYLWGYGLGRVWIEGLRTDSLLVPGLNVRVSQLLAAVCVLMASVILVKKRVDYVKTMTSESTE